MTVPAVGLDGAVDGLQRIHQSAELKLLPEPSVYVLHMIRNLRTEFMVVSMSLTGLVVLHAFKSDIEGFFHPDAGFVMNTAVQGYRTRYIGGAEKGGIAVGEDLAGFEVENLESLMLLLLVLGHEAAHLLNVHGRYRDQGNDETKALEVWADFFGTKVALVVMTIGDKVQDLVSSLPGGDETGARLDAIGEAIGRLATTYFDTDDGRYEPAPVRVATCVAGVMSALDTFWRLHGIDRDVERSISLQLRLYQAPAMKDMLARVGAAAPDRAQIPAIRRIHQIIQGDRSSITAGMQPLPAEWLRTNYEGSEEERVARVKEELELLKAELTRLGFDGPDDE